MSWRLLDLEPSLSATIPSSAVATDSGAFTGILSTAGADADMQLIVDSLATITSDTNPEYRVKITNTAGTLIGFAQVAIAIGGSAKLVTAFPIPVTAADGGRVCVYVDTNKSEAADVSDCTSSGGMSGWAMAYFGGSTVNWANCGSNALSAVNTPVAGTNGPLGLSWTYVSADSDAHTAANSGSGGEFAYAAYEAFLAGNADYSSGEKVSGNIPSEVVSRGPNSSAVVTKVKSSSGKPRTESLTGLTENTVYDVQIQCDRGERVYVSFETE